MSIVKQYGLDTGQLRVEIDVNGERADEYFDVAQRINPRRPFLFVSKVLGRHIPVKPSTMAASYEELAQPVTFNPNDVVTVIGMAETAVGLGAGVHNALLEKGANSLYISSSRHQAGPAFCEFREEHSHAQCHYLHQPLDEKDQAHLASTTVLVLVDDEATTGKTFVNLLQALRDSGLNTFASLYTVTLTDWSQGAVEQKLAVLERVKRHSVSKHYAYGRRLELARQR